MKDLQDPIRNQPCHLPAGIAMPHPTALPRTPRTTPLNPLTLQDPVVTVRATLFNVHKLYILSHCVFL